VESGRPPNPSLLNSNSQHVYEDLKYSKEDIEQIEEWVKRHVETTWHSLGVSVCHLFKRRCTNMSRHAPWLLRKGIAL
jgi:alcohol oxidase